MWALRPLPVSGKRLMPFASPRLTSAVPLFLPERGGFFVPCAYNIQDLCKKIQWYSLQKFAVPLVPSDDFRKRGRKAIDKAAVSVI